MRLPALPRQLKLPLEMRLFRGESSLPRKAMSPWLEEAVGPAIGRWWTQDPRIAEWYVQPEHTLEGIIKEIAVDPDVAEPFRAINQPDVQTFSRDWENEYFLPEDLLAEALKTALTHKRGAFGPPK